MIFSILKNGDSVVIDSKTISIGIKHIISIVDDITGIDVNNIFKKYFKVTVDGCNWSQDWIELTNSNLQDIDTKKNHPFGIVFKYIKEGDDTTPLIINSIQINTEYEKIDPPAVFGKMGIFDEIDFWNQDSLQWYVNVLQKIYEPGVLPKYITRGELKNEDWGDEDFLDFWFPMLYMYALVYKKQLHISDFNHYKKILFDFLKQRDITPSYVSDLGDLYEIASQFIKMMSKRGGIDMITPKDRDNQRYNDGELIRVFGINSETDEFELIRLKSENVPWCIDSSSPCYSSLNGVEEASKKIFLQKYSSGYINDNTETNHESKTEFAVNYNQSYIVEFDLVVEDSVSPYHALEMRFGIVGLDVYGNKINFKSLTDNTPFSNFVSNTSLTISSNNTYHFWGILYSTNEFDITSSSLKINNSYNLGNNLKIDDVQIVKAYTYLYLHDGGVPFVVNNYSVKPLKTDTSRMFLNDSNQSILIARNRNYDMGEEDLKTYIGQTLLPYDQTTFYKLLK